MTESASEAGAYAEAVRLADALWRQHYQADAPNWRPLSDLVGVITQISNMTAGMIRKPRENS